MPEPRRIQRKRAKGWRMPEGTIYVGRGSQWGNPFTHTDKAVAARMYRVWLTGACRSGDMLECRKVLPGPLEARRAEIRDHLAFLRGRNLACWCREGEPCHADVLVDLANA